MTLSTLQELIAKGDFHHATYRCIGSLWEGLWIYQKSASGFRDYAPAGCFGKNHSDLRAAENMVRSTGISVGAYGNG